MAAGVVTGQSGSPARSDSHVGTVAMEISCADPARAPFLRGMALLHSFVWDEARTAFQAAAAAAPDCAMAYWGEAMSYYDGLHEPPGDKEVAAAREALGKAAAAATATPRERAYVAAARALFDEFPRPGRRERDQAYSQALAAVRDGSPDDEDAGALYALSLLSLARRGVADGHALQMKAAQILEAIFAAHPDHPGAAHYLIHAYDDSGERERGLAAARAYARIAPAVTHALHMPSHIFAGLGMWDETIASNTAAFDASGNRYYHGLLYWFYALIQKGDERAAEALLAEHRAQLEGGNETARASLHNLLARWYLDTDRPAEAAVMPILSDEPLIKAEALYVRGLGQARTAQADLAETSLRDMRRVASALAESQNVDVGVRVRILDVQAKQLEAAILEARGRGDDAVRLLEETTRIEDQPGVSWAPPDAGTGLPAHELLGEMLLKLNRTSEAAREFEKALAKTPHRRRAVLGLARATGRGERRSVER
jgi:tetratricopeptide (TPR) repeat protein